jgi:cytochrome c peroxidase
MNKPGTICSFFLSLASVPFCLLVGGSAFALDTTEPDFDLKLLGKYVFFDNISNPSRMACVTCHDPDTGGTGSVSGVNLHQVVITGANPHTAGNLKPPTNTYASFLKPFHACGSGGLPNVIVNPGPPPVRVNTNYCGGNFWDGRAEGNGHPEDSGPGAVFTGGATKHIGNEVFQGLAPAPMQYANYFGPTSDQALNPMPNTVEQNIDRKAVCEHVASAKYAELYKRVWGVTLNCSDDPAPVGASDVGGTERQFDISFKRIMLAVGAWQHSRELNSFSSRRDKALQRELDGIDVDSTPGKFPLVGLTAQENYGHDLFYATFARPLFVPDPNNPDGPPLRKVSNCAFCHSDNPVLPGPGVKDDGSEPFQLYTAQDYHNIGVPANPEIPTLSAPLQPPTSHGISDHSKNNVIIPALPGFKHPSGFFKTPTLRNVDKRKGNGFIKAYAHNGWFKSLESIVHFYNTGFVPGATAQSFGITRCEGTVTEKEALARNCWPYPEFPNNPATPDAAGALPFLVGNLGLTAEDEAALVAYMKTLTDTETPKAPNPYK